MSDTIYSPRTLKVRIDRSLSYSDRVKLETMSNEHRLLYNHLLEQTQGEIGSDFKKLNSAYVNFRHENKLTIPSKAAQNTCISLINNMKSFFALKKKDTSARFPHRFKSWKFFTSFTYDWNGGGGGFYFTPTELVIRKPEIRIKLPSYVTLNLEDIAPGLLIDRDVNGAINIANKNLGNWSPQWAWLTGLRDTPLLVCE